MLCRPTPSQVGAPVDLTGDGTSAALPMDPKYSGPSVPWNRGHESRVCPAGRPRFAAARPRARPPRRSADAKNWSAGNAVLIFGR